MTIRNKKIVLSRFENTPSKEEREGYIAIVNPLTHRYITHVDNKQVIFSRSYNPISIQADTTSPDQNALEKKQRCKK